jgi:hypothetical protein
MGSNGVEKRQEETTRRNNMRVEKHEDMPLKEESGIYAEI